MDKEKGGREREREVLPCIGRKREKGKLITQKMPNQFGLGMFA